LLGRDDVVLAVTIIVLFCVFLILCALASRRFCRAEGEQKPSVSAIRIMGLRRSRRRSRRRTIEQDGIAFVQVDGPSPAVGRRQGHSKVDPNGLEDGTAARAPPGTSATDAAPHLPQRVRDGELSPMLGSSCFSWGTERDDAGTDGYAPSPSSTRSSLPRSPKSPHEKR
jgi:hypothetical protein